MLHQKLINPKSIAIIGGSRHLDHIGGSVLSNLIEQGYQGELYVVNPKEDKVQGIRSYRDSSLLPATDLAIIAIPAKDILPVVKTMATDKGTKAFIIYTAGFSELDDNGSALEAEITEAISKAGGSLLGPNNIGMINQHYAGIFTKPIPVIDKKGVDFVSASGATAVFTLEAAHQLGLRFSGLYTVGNSPQIGVEEILEYLDQSFDLHESSKVKMLYIEGIKNPEKFLKHCLSLKQKGCSIVALKSGITAKGKAAAASHTGAMVNPNIFVEALFNKAGIIQCSSRYELVNCAALLQISQKKPMNWGIITHAGGPGVILTDTLTKNKLVVTDLSTDHQEALKQLLYNGAATNNPIDILATGTAQQLDQVLDYCDQEIKEFDAMAVIFGSPGLGSVKDAYQVIHKKIKECNKPVYAILPSVVNVEKEIRNFVDKGNIAFYDEHLFATCVAKINKTPHPCPIGDLSISIPKSKIRDLIKALPSGFLNPADAFKLLETAGIPMAKQSIIQHSLELDRISKTLDFPVVVKVVGPLHKSDLQGVITNVLNVTDLKKSFKKLMLIKGAEGVLIQEMILGKEVFIGGKRATGFAPLVICGAGGIYIETLKDYNFALAPVSIDEAIKMVDKLQITPILKGTRGEAPCNLNAFYKTIVKVSHLLNIAPEIAELDINPLMINNESVIAVDVRIRIEKI